jgi:hypothetical protein
MARTRGYTRTMRIPSILGVIYLVIGVVVASQRDYLDDLDRLKRILSAILAIVLWPLVLVGIDVRFR